MMFIPNTMPSTLADMLAFLLPTVEDGLFDSVAYDNESSPTKIVCTQGGNTILDISISAGAFTFTPYVTDGTAATGQHLGKFVPYATLTPTSNGSYARCMRCKGGAVFVCCDNQISGTRSQHAVCICKGSNGKTALITENTGISGDSSYPMRTGEMRAYFTTCFGDITTLPLYISGHKLTTDSTDAGDRTILAEFPIIGEWGSTDKVVTAFYRKAVQFATNGQQTIGGKTYGCLQYFAVLDE